MFMLHNDLLFLISLYLEKDKNFLCIDKETYSVCKLRLYKIIKIQRWFRNQYIMCMFNRRRGRPMSIYKLIKDTKKYRNRKIQFILTTPSTLADFKNLPIIWNCVYKGHTKLHHKEYIYVAYPGFVEIHGSKYYKRFVTPGYTVYFQADEILKQSVKVFYT